MSTKNDEFEYTEHSGSTKSLLTGLVIGGLVGAGSMLLFAPQAGQKTRAELQEGVGQLREKTSETVKVKLNQARTKADELKATAQTKAGELQNQGQDVIAKQLDRVSELAEAGKKAIGRS